MQANSEQAPKVFISYSHDSANHKRWVADLAKKLRENGIDVILDQWDLSLGDDVPKFMEKSVTEADRVLMICTEKYVTKADEGSGGVGYEAMIVTGQLVRDLGTSKFIPVIRQQSQTPTIPKSLSPRMYISFSDGENYEERFHELLGELHKISKRKKPPLGPNPFTQYLGAGAVGTTRSFSSSMKGTAVGAASQWRVSILLSPEHPRAIPKHQLLDHLIEASYSQPLDTFSRRYQFPLEADRSNLLQNLQEGWIGAKVEYPSKTTSKYEISTDGSARLTIIHHFKNAFRSVQGDDVLLETIRFWPFASRYWTKFLPQLHHLTLHIEGIQDANLSLDMSLAGNLVSKTNEYEIKDVPFLAASGLEGAKELLLQTCHNMVTAFVPSHGVSKNDLRLEYFERKAKEYLAEVRDYDPLEG